MPPVSTGWRTLHGCQHHAQHARQHSSAAAVTDSVASNARNSPGASAANATGNCRRRRHQIGRDARQPSPPLAKPPVLASERQPRRPARPSLTPPHAACAPPPTAPTPAPKTPRSVAAARPMLNARRQLDGDPPRPRRHHHHPRRQIRRLIQRMRHEHRRAAQSHPSALDGLILQPVAREFIQRREWLVHQQQHARTGHQRARNGNPHPHSAGQRHAAGRIGKSGSSPTCASAVLRQPRRIPPISAQPQRQRHVFQQHSPTASAPGPGTQIQSHPAAGCPAAPKPAFRRIRPLQPRNQPQECRFSAAGRPQQGQKLATRFTCKSMPARAVTPFGTVCVTEDCGSRLKSAAVLFREKGLLSSSLRRLVPNELQRIRLVDNPYPPDTAPPAPWT